MPPASLAGPYSPSISSGEFRYAEPATLLAEDEDRLLTTCIQVTRDDKTVQERRQRYQQLNDLGIKAYQAGELEQALSHFRGPARAPANTRAPPQQDPGAAATHAEEPQEPEFGTECRETWRCWRHPLNPAQQGTFSQAAPGNIISSS